MSLALLVLSLLPIPFLILIVLVMWRRKQHVVYPAFWTYLCVQVAGLASEFICKGISYKTFFYAYWISSFLNLIFQLLLLRDIFSTALGKYPRLDKFRRSLYEIALATLCLIAVIAVFLGERIHGLSKMIFTAELVISFVAVGVFVFVAASAIVLGIKWKSALCGMAAGLGLLGIVDLIVFAIMTHSSRLSPYASAASWAETIGYDLAICIFALYFLPMPREVPPPKQVRPELLDWAESMRGSLPR
jgi:hypothetical protein